jgi:hypothetical protein
VAIVPHQLEITVIERFLLALMFLLLASSALAQSDKSYNLQIAVSDLCQSMSLVRYTSSTHPGGNADGRHNEKNTGTALLCYHRLWKGSNEYFEFYTKAGDLKNSRSGNTPHYGFGAVTNLVNTRFGEHRGKIRLGAELLRIKYEVPKYNATLTTTQTLPYYGIAYEYNGWFEASMNQYIIGEGVTLRAFSVVWKKKMNFF